jgi:hypothetical protein
LELVQELLRVRRVPLWRVKLPPVQETHALAEMSFGRSENVQKSNREFMPNIFGAAV